ncbi:MAG: aminotransferase class I/II-fold pyridoxal phosphate-dependent enzyme [Saprospiraceae bacterium]|nr:aminotransferase class I/II-fold pyridoxal phosphate-dependent enzyme [Saprospiraceae bacterium]
MKPIDLRSDTVTLPTPAMKQTMFDAPVGDDVHGDDPSVTTLQDETAAYFGHEAGLFCPSGTMTNQIAIKCHTSAPGSVICHELSHVYKYEVGGIAFNSGMSVNLVRGTTGLLTAQDVLDQLHDTEDVHKCPSQLVVLENTSNKGGGCCYDLKTLEEIREVCDQHNLKLHLDGARVFNALVSRGYSARDMGQYFDSISICFSKGMGAPVGSVLVGKKDFIHRAQWLRKLFGGGMRQAGYLAAAANYALHNHVERMQEDHSRAKAIEKTLSELDAVVKILPVETNIIIFQLQDYTNSKDFLAKLGELGVLAAPFGKQMVRFVTHLDFDDAQLECLLVALKQVDAMYKKEMV